MVIRINGSGGFRGSWTGCCLILAWVWAACAAADDSLGLAAQRRLFSAAEIRGGWILDGTAERTVLGEHELKITAQRPMAVWCPTVFQGPVAVDFECLVPEPQTKLLVLIFGHGSDGTPIRGWQRDGTYDHYNAGRMEVYSIAINRGPHVSDRPEDQLANVRRIGGPELSIYTSENFRLRARQGLGFWQQWNTRSLVGAAREPAWGVNRYLHYRITVDPPHLMLEVEGTRFAEFVDHRNQPLTKGAIGFRCMTKGRTFQLRNVSIAGRAEQGPK